MAKRTVLRNHRLIKIACFIFKNSPKTKNQYQFSTNFFVFPIKILLYLSECFLISLF